MNLRCDSRGPVLVLTINSPRLDAASVDAFREQAAENITPGLETCIVDLGHVTSIDSAGIGALASLMNRLGRHRRLELCAVGPAVRRVLRITRLERVFSLRATLDDALAAASRDRLSPSTFSELRSAS